MSCAQPLVEICLARSGLCLGKTCGHAGREAQGGGDSIRWYARYAVFKVLCATLTYFVFPVPLTWVGLSRTNRTNRTEGARPKPGQNHSWFRPGSSAILKGSAVYPWSSSVRVRGADPGAAPLMAFPAVRRHGLSPSRRPPSSL